MVTRRIRRVRLVAVQGAAVGIAAVFLALAIAGFTPGLTSDLHTMTWTGQRSVRPVLLGVFEVSILHNLLHLLTGVVGLLMARTFARSRAYLIGGGLAYLGLWLYGMLEPHGRNLLPLNGADNWLHFALGLAMVILGLTLGGTRAPTGADGELLVPE